MYTTMQDQGVTKSGNHVRTNSQKPLMKEVGGVIIRMV